MLLRLRIIKLAVVMMLRVARRTKIRKTFTALVVGIVKEMDRR